MKASAIEPLPGSQVPNSLHIAVIGMGGIGSAFAFQLARAGHHNVTAVARPGSVRLRQLQRDGGVVDAKGEHAAMHVTDSLEANVPTISSS